MIKLPRKIKVDLDEEAERYLATKKRSTSKAYRANLKRFVQFYGKNVEEFIKNVESWREKNKSLPITERRRYAEDVVRELIEWLKEKGYANNSIRQTLTAVQNLLQFYELPLSYRFIDIPSSNVKKINIKQKWKIEQIKEFIEAAEYLRDKAIIACHFQSGLGIGDVISLDYGDVRRQLNSGELPILIDVQREKTGVNFKTLLGADAVKYLDLYLKTRGDLRDEDPLFARLGSNIRVTEGAIQNNFRKYAEKLSWLEPKDLEGWNPARPHSLRAAFRSRLTNRVDPTLIEFWMGHEIGDVGRAYLQMPDEEHKEIYSKIEYRISIETTSEQAKAKKSLPGDEKRIEELERQIGDLYEQLGAMNALKERIEELQDYIEAHESTGRE